MHNMAITSTSLSTFTPTKALMKIIHVFGWLQLLLHLAPSTCLAYRFPALSSAPLLHRHALTQGACSLSTAALASVSRGRISSSLRTGVTHYSRSRGAVLGASQGNKDETKELMDFSGLGELMNNLKKAQDLALEAEKFNKEFAQQSFQGKDSRGLVTATFNGMAEPTGISFTDSVLQLGKETVAAATMEALAQGHLKAKNAAMQRLQSIMTMPRSMREAAFGNQEGFGGPPGGDVSGGGEETEAGDDVK